MYREGCRVELVDSLIFEYWSPRCISEDGVDSVFGGVGSVGVGELMEVFLVGVMLYGMGWDCGRVGL